MRAGARSAALIWAGGCAPCPPLGVRLDLAAQTRMVRGPQGGWHLPLTAAVEGDGLLLWRAAATSDGVPVSAGGDDYIDADCVGEAPDRVLLAGALLDDDRPMPARLACRSVDVEACVAHEGDEVCAAATTVLLPDPTDVEAGLTQDCP